MDSLTTKERKKLIFRLLEKYDSYDFFNEEYVSNLINLFEKETLVIEGIKVSYEDSNNINPSYYLYYKCIDFLNYKLCLMAKSDDDILLQLMLDYTYVIEFVCRRLNCDVDAKYDEYMKECFFAYNGKLPLYLFVARYLVCQIKGKKITVEDLLKEKEIESLSDEKKIKKKKKKSEEFVNKEEVFEEIEDKQDNIDYAYYESKALKISNENKPDYFVNLFNEFNLKDYFLATGDSDFLIYIYLRFEKNISLEIIAEVLNISLKQVIIYEKEVLERIRDEFNTRVDEYLRLVLR